MNAYFFYFIISLLYVILIYKKIKRSIGFQKYTEDKIKFKIGIMIMFVSFILLTLELSLENIVLYTIASMVGFVLAFVSKKLTLFEIKDTLVYYKTYILIEILILVILILRLIYRLPILLKIINSIDLEIDVNEVSNPYTLAIFFLTFSYYIFFNFLLWKEIKKYSIDG